MDNNIENNNDSEIVNIDERIEDNQTEIINIDDNNENVTQNNLVQSQGNNDSIIVENAHTLIYNNEKYISESEIRKNYIRKKGPFKKMIGMTIWLVVFIWAALIIIDFLNLSNDRDLSFCIERGINEYSDGSVEWCMGPGYKVYKYDRECFSGAEFGPFWNEDRSLTQEACNQ